MKYSFTHKDGFGQLHLLENEAHFSQNYYNQKTGFTFHTIAWNQGQSQVVTIDEIKYTFHPNSVLPIMFNQTFHFERPEDIIAWQFNREFFGPSQTMFIKLDDEDLDMLQRLLVVFEEEFLSDEEIKSEMLRMLLARLIIKITRLAKKQYIGSEEVVDEKFNIIRQFNLLVEIHFRKEHQVSFYAGLLNKSPKTISNYFSLYSKKTPTQIIQERIIAEAKRLFYFTEKSIKEIADEIGFEDTAHFSKFFKNCTSQSPSELKKTVQIKK
jgi:AraC family transcriptional regulator, transcriptional activator of pobA